MISMKQYVTHTYKKIKRKSKRKLILDAYLVTEFIKHNEKSDETEHVTKVPNGYYKPLLLDRICFENTI